MRGVFDSAARSRIKGSPLRDDVFAMARGVSGGHALLANLPAPRVGPENGERWRLHEAGHEPASG